MLGGAGEGEGESTGEGAGLHGGGAALRCTEVREEDVDRLRQRKATPRRIDGFRGADTNAASARRDFRWELQCELRVAYSTCSTKYKPNTMANL